MWNKCFQGKTMSKAASEAQLLLHSHISPPVAGESMKVRKANAARYVGLTYGRVEKLWYANARRIDAEEIDLLRAAAEKKKAAPTTLDGNTSGQDLWTIVTEIRASVQELRAHIDRLDRISRTGR